MIVENLSDIRRDYGKDVLLEQNMNSDPIEQFKQWFGEVLACKSLDPTVMTLSTISPEGLPKARIVLLKGIVHGNFRFFTNYNSQKGYDLSKNPYASLSFYWANFERQIRIEGKTEKTSEKDNDEYFFSRPIESRLSTWVSKQSRYVDGRDVLDQRQRFFKRRFGNTPPRPLHWGGYQVIPESMEFWQGRPSRLHDRLVYLRNSDGSWLLKRLFP